MSQGFFRSAAAGLALLVLGQNPAAKAQTFTSSFKGSSGQTENAAAIFSFANGTLTMVLENTSTFTTYSNPDVLSGVFFAIAGNPVLTPISATASKPVNTCPTCISGDVGVNYGYNYSTSGFKLNTASFTSDAYGVGAPGYSSLSPGFGHGIPSFKPGTNHATGQGLSYSIVGPDYTGGGNGPFVEGSVTFAWSALPGVNSLSISNVIFTYGTAPDGSNPAKVPEPSALAVLGTAVAALARIRRRRAGATSI